jgi:hypothetical protein
MTKKYMKHVHVKMDEETYNKALMLANICCEGKISQLVRRLINEKYEETFGKKSGDKA